MKYLLFCLIGLFIAGCVSATYNPETKLVTYQRFGDQKLGGVEIVFPDGSYIAFESQRSEARLLNDALRLIEKGIELGAAK